MQQYISQAITSDSSTATIGKPPAKLIYYYSELLNKYQFAYTESTYYLEVGEPSLTQGWIFDISIIGVQFQRLFEAIIPLLIREKLAFKIAKDAEVARAILAGEYGYPLLGKIIAIYPSDEKSALAIAKELIDLTKDFKGPKILTDRNLSGIVFTRYGAYRPIKRHSEQGIVEECIYNKTGNLVKDACTIPFQMPDWVNWPFSSITQLEETKPETVLQDKYKPMAYLKKDTKGTVRKGLYLERWWRIKWCVIKEGKQYMGGDFLGRDMSDRLRWQYELHQDLQDLVALPKIYDFFEENGHTYLVMEYIKGRSLNSIVPKLLEDRAWWQTPVKNRLLILGYFSQALDIIDRMHQKGYVHRDITPANFIVGPKTQLKMIDLELSYNSTLRKPYPPFRLGTPGYMSPEQMDTRTPKVEQDIYALGALLVRMLTGLSPEKYAVENPETLRRQLAFFITDEEVVSILCDCLSEEPRARPSIISLKAIIGDFQKKQPATTASRQTFEDHPMHLTKIINDSLTGLVSRNMLNEENIWQFPTTQEVDYFNPMDISKAIYPGFSSGLSGVLYLVAKARQLGFEIGNCKEAYNKSLEFISHNFQEKLLEMPGGLYFGTAGIALAQIEGVRSGLIQNTNKTLKLIDDCLQNSKLFGAGMIKGISGQGLVLLRATSILNEINIQPLLVQKVNDILAAQESDGSWLTETDRNKKPIKPTGFGHGISGILYFLLEYTKISKNDPRVKRSIENGLDWLIKTSYTKHSTVKWHFHDNTRLSSLSFLNGYSGIVLCLIKAYEVLGNSLYRELAEGCLRNYADHPVKSDCTQSDGLSGLGEVYLEASKIFDAKEWQLRADWIVQFLSHHFVQEKSGASYWLPNEGPFTNAGFMEGNSGIIHFLLRYHQPHLLNHPLSGN